MLDNLARRDDSVTVGEALTRHYAMHGLPQDGGEGAAWFRIQLGPLRIPLPNPPARRRAVFWHDVNHVLTGYNTTFSDGEMTIAGFEVGAGCGRSGIAWFINLVMMAYGLLVRPRAVYRAFVRGRRSASIYRCTATRATLREMTVREVRNLVAIAEPDVHPAPGDQVSFTFWCLVAWLVTLAMFAVGIGAVWIGLMGLMSLADRVSG
ncbi:MAG TPA: hypothetical protein VJ717_02040 [Gemmatimonadaceae bacterium]|nr:hypothetical protein [Gemmatimonadaceae bacterium]